MDAKSVRNISVQISDEGASLVASFVEIVVAAEKTANENGELRKLATEQRELLAKGAEEVKFLKDQIARHDQDLGSAQVTVGALYRILKRYVTLNDEEINEAVLAEIELSTRLGKGEPSVA